MPAKDAEATIAASASSVLSCAEVLELVVVDDKSTDNTRKILQELNDSRIVILEGDGKGIAAAFNKGLAAANGEFVGRCDSDDLYVDHILKDKLKILREHNEVIAVSSAYQTITVTDKTVTDLANQGDLRDVTLSLLDGKPVTHFCTWVTRCRSLREISGAREWFVTAEDLDMQFRLAKIGAVWHLPKVGYRYRIHATSITHTQSDVKRKFYERCASEFACERRDLGTDVLESGAPPDVPVGDNYDMRRHHHHIAGQYQGKAWALCNERDHVNALKSISQAIRHNPLGASHWISFFKILVLAFVPRSKSY